MFSALSNSQREMFFTPQSGSYSESEDDHYEEEDDNYSILDDGILLNEDLDDEYEDFEDEMESDIPEPIDSDNIDASYITVDEEEAEHYDSIEDEE